MTVKNLHNHIDSIDLKIITNYTITYKNSREVVIELETQNSLFGECLNCGIPGGEYDPHYCRGRNVRGMF